MHSSRYTVGHAHRRRRSEQRRHLGHRVGLAPEVELGAQALRELREQLAGAEPLAERRAALGEVGEQRRARRGRAPSSSSMPGRWTLTTTASPVRSRRPVGLADRRRGERLPVELGEHVVDRAAELGLEHRRDAARRGSGGTRFCSSASSSQTSRRQEVDAGRGDLAELDVDAAGLLEHPPQPHARRVVGALGASGGGEERAEALLRERGARARGSGGAPRSAVATARTGRGATTRPARSPIASEPGRASRSSATATAIVAGMPMASDADDEAVGAPVPVVERRARRRSPMPQPTTPASSAVPHPRRIPSSRSDSSVTTTATTTQPTTDAQHDADEARPGERRVIDPPRCTAARRRRTA